MKFTCEYCHKVFESRHTERTTKFCSRQCYQNSIRKIGRKYCEICHKVLTEERLSVHHIIPFRKFGKDIDKANEFSNLISLCYSCHSKVEHGTLELNIS